MFADEFEPARFYDARLLVTELVGSAVAAGGTAPVRLEATLDGDLFRADVIDMGSGFVGETRGIAALDAGRLGPPPRGRARDRWGTHERQGVWFEMDLTRAAPEVADFVRPRGASQ